MAELVTKLIWNFCDETEIEVAKTLLFLTWHLRCLIVRRNVKKKNINVQDMLHFLLNFEVADLPSFVARDLAHFGTIDYNSY